MNKIHCITALCCLIGVTGFLIFFAPYDEPVFHYSPDFGAEESCTVVMLGFKVDPGKPGQTYVARLDETGKILGSAKVGSNYCLQFIFPLPQAEDAVVLKPGQTMTICRKTRLSNDFLAPKPKPRLNYEAISPK